MEYRISKKVNTHRKDIITKINIFVKHKQIQKLIGIYKTVGDRLLDYIFRTLD